MLERYGLKMRKTKIVCTIGPASSDEDTLRELMKSGMDVARFNFSHGVHDEKREIMNRLKRIREELGLNIPIMLDTKGPEIRLGDFEGEKVALKAGQTFALTTEEMQGTNERATITYKDLPKDVKKGDKILIDDGLIEMEVLEVCETDIVCKVLNGGNVSNHKGINVPNVHLSMAYMSDQDKADILFGIQEKVDFVAASFVRTAQDVNAIRNFLKDNGGEFIQIISKIENLQGIRNLDSILEASDAIMVARGDMGVEIPLEDVPVYQKLMIKKAIALGKHVITATQMLDSMMKNPRPTRAETTDVANAIYDGTSAVMLSGETASGSYPIEAVKTMDKIAVRTEADIDYIGRFHKIENTDEILSITNAISHATCATAMDIYAKAIITVTLSGFTARMVSRFRPKCTIVGFSSNPVVCRQLNLTWGVKPVFIEEASNSDELLTIAEKKALELGYIEKGDKVVFTAGVPIGTPGMTNLLKAVEVK